MGRIRGIPPAVTDETSAYWEAARRGQLLAQRCDACGAKAFPPRSMCRACRSRHTSLIEVKGPGRVYSFTINHQRWLPELEVPFAIVLVEFDAHPGVRIPGRLCGCAHAAVAIGMPVDVGFEPGPDDFAIPSFVARSEREP